MSNYILYFDGCSKGNPGIAGSGAVLYDNDVEIWSDCYFVGANITNNVSEYDGLIHGLQECVDRGIAVLLVRGDSELIVKQMKGKYKVKSPNLMKSYEKASSLSKHFTNIQFEHVYRDFNKRADELSNDGLIKQYRF